MSWPESAPAANWVLRAAEAWRDKLIPSTSTSHAREAQELAAAVDAYRATGYIEQTTIAKEPGD